MYSPEQMKFAQSVIAEYNQKLRDADNLAKKAKIYAIKATSAQLKLTREICGRSINDILDSMESTGLLNDPEFRDRILDASKTLNSERRK